MTTEIISNQALTEDESEALSDYEAVIDQGLKTFIEVGNALAAIRDKRLYRELFGTFEEYCQTRWGLTGRHVNRTITAAAVVKNLGPMGPKPTNERQARSLAILPPKQQAEVWREAVESAPNGKVTARHVEETVKRRSVPMENYRATTHEPHIQDCCQTPPYALDPLYEYLDPNQVIWEPAAGEGYLVSALKSKGFTVIGSDIITGQNFFDFAPSEWDVLITNPPYHSGVLGQWIERCYSFGKPFALLMKLTTLGVKYGFEPFRKYGLELIIFDKRINYKMPNKGWDGDAQFASGWFTWGLGLGQQITFMELDSERTIETREEARGEVG